LNSHRVLSRPKAAAFVVVLLAVVAALLWLAMDWIDAYQRYMSGLQASSPELAVTVLANHLRLFSILQAVPLWLFAAYLAWHAHKGIRTESMPPLGSWIVEGQRIRTGRQAVRIAQFLIVLAALLAIAAVAAAVLLWNIAKRFQLLGNSV